MTKPGQTSRIRRISIDDGTAQWLADLGRQPGRLSGNLSRGVKMAAEYLKEHIKQIPLEKGGE